MQIKENESLLGSHKEEQDRVDASSGTEGSIQEHQMADSKTMSLVQIFDSLGLPLIE